MMYWRVRRLSFKDMLSKYWVGLALIISLFFNVVLLLTRPNPHPAMSKDTKADYDQFARTVTSHLLDSSYISYKDSTNALLSGELHPDVVRWMKEHNLLAKNADEMEATAKALYDQRQVSAIHITSVDQLPSQPGQPIPIEVKGEVAIHSAQDSGPTSPVPFHLRYGMALQTEADKKTWKMGEDGRPLHYVVNFQEIGGQN